MMLLDQMKYAQEMMDRKNNMVAGYSNVVHLTELKDIQKMIVKPKSVLQNLEPLEAIQSTELFKKHSGENNGKPTNQRTSLSELERKKETIAILKSVMTKHVKEEQFTD